MKMTWSVKIPAPNLFPIRPLDTAPAAQEEHATARPRRDDLNIGRLPPPRLKEARPVARGQDQQPDERRGSTFRLARMEAISEERIDRRYPGAPPVPEVPANFLLGALPNQDDHMRTSALGTADLEAQNLPSVAHPDEASSLKFFAAQFARHLVPVLGSRTLAQGVVGPALARLIGSNPEVASAVQSGIACWSAARLIMSHVNTRSATDVAELAFSGLHGERPDSARRKAWQRIQRASIVTGDALSIALTSMSVNHQSLKRLAQTVSTIQVRAHLLSAGRELLRPAINTVHVGSRAPDVSWPATGRNLRTQDIDGKMRLQYGLAVGAAELVAQTLMQFTLGGKAPWEAAASVATAAGAVSGLANTLTSSFEDYLLDSASARRMQLTDPAHVRHLHFESCNPFSYRELGRQLERVDARTFNQMLPSILAAGILFGLEKLLASPTKQVTDEVLTAGITALLNAVILGGLLAVTAQTYQLNDAIRHHHADRRERDR